MDALAHRFAALFPPSDCLLLSQIKRNKYIKAGRRLRRIIDRWRHVYGLLVTVRLPVIAPVPAIFSPIVPPVMFPVPAVISVPASSVSVIVRIRKRWRTRQAAEQNGHKQPHYRFHYSLAFPDIKIHYCLGF